MLAFQTPINCGKPAVAKTLFIRLRSPTQPRNTQCKSKEQIRRLTDPCERLKEQAVRRGLGLPGVPIILIMMGMPMSRLRYFIGALDTQWESKEQIARFTSPRK